MPFCFVLGFKCFSDGCFTSLYCSSLCPEGAESAQSTQPLLRGICSGLFIILSTASSSLPLIDKQEISLGLFRKLSPLLGGEGKLKETGV